MVAIRLRIQSDAIKLQQTETKGRMQIKALCSQNYNLHMILGIAINNIANAVKT